MHVDAGMSATGVTFALSASKLANIGGMAVDLAGHPVGPAGVIMMQTQGGDVRAVIPAGTPVAPDGSFRYRNVPAGTYVLQVMAQAGFGSLLLTVDGTEQTDLRITVRPPTTAHGHISFDGDGPPPKGQVSVMMRPTDFVSGPAGGNAMPRSRVNDDWSFDLPGLQSVGVLMAGGAPPWRLKSATVDGKDIADTPYDFRMNDVNNIEVVLTSRVGSLTGTIVDGDKPAPNCSIYLFPEDKSKWAYPARLVSPAQSEPNGNFAVGAVLPGRYLVVAVPLLLVQEVDPAYLESLRTVATPVTIDEGKAATVALKLVKR